MVVKMKRFKYLRILLVGMNTLRRLWNSIPVPYKTIGALVVGLIITEEGQHMVDNRAYASFDPQTKAVRYTILDTDGFLGYGISVDGGLESVVNRDVAGSRLPTDAAGFIRLPPGKHVLTATYEDGAGNHEKKVMDVDVPKY